LQSKNDGEISPSAEGGEVDPPILLKAKILARSRQKAFGGSANTHFSP